MNGERIHATGREVSERGTSRDDAKSGIGRSDAIGYEALVLRMLQRNAI